MLKEVTIYTNLNCNLKCRMCYMNGVSQQNNRYSFDKQNQIMEYELFKRAIDEFYHENKNCSYWFMGGEPLLHNDIVTMVEYIKHTGNGFVDINTNGTLLGQKGKLLMDAGVDSVTISLDGHTAKICDSIRGAGVFSKAAPEVVHLINYRDTYNKNAVININFTLTNMNYKNTIDMAKICNEWGVDNFYIDFPSFITYEDGLIAQNLYKQWFHEDVLSWKGQVIDEVYQNMDKNIIFDQFMKIQEMDKSYKFDVVPHGYTPKELSRFFDSSWDQIVSSRVCSKTSYRTTLLPDGGIAPCTLYHDFTVGNMQEEDFKSIWHGKRYQYFREKIRNSMTPFCKRCCDLLDEHDEFIE